MAGSRGLDGTGNLAFGRQSEHSNLQEGILVLHILPCQRFSTIMQKGRQLAQDIDIAYFLLQAHASAVA